MNLPSVADRKAVLAVREARKFESVCTSFRDSMERVGNEAAVSFEEAFRNFDEACRKAQRVRAATTPALSVLRVFGLTRRELCHSDALAWFLRKDAEHEQGDRFLNALLKLLGMKDHKGSYFVEREKFGRVDVAAYAHGLRGFAVFIENKVKSRERKDQVADMGESLERNAQSRGIPRKRCCSVFLTDDGRAPKTGKGKPLRRIDLFRRFQAALFEAPTRSDLMTRFLASYIHEIGELT